MKKLATILALTAVVANFGLATVFAQIPSHGTQKIACPAGEGAQLFTVTTPVAFEQKPTDWYNNPGNAELTTNLDIVVTDTRGYKCAGTGYTYSIAETSAGVGLVEPVSGDTLGLSMDQALDASNDSCTSGGAPSTACDPATLSVFDYSHAPAVPTPIDLGIELFRTSEPFAGEVTVEMPIGGHKLTVLTPTAPIAAGDYAGDILFTQA